MANDLESSILTDAASIDTELANSEQSNSSISNEQQNAINEEISMEEKYGDSDLKAGAIAAARGASLGVSDVIAKETGLLSEEDLRELDERNSTASTLGEIGGVAASALLSGSASILGKGAASATKAAARAGLATEHFIGKGLQTLIGNQTKKSIVADILKNTISKGAGLSVEGAFYSTGHLLSENALGRADLNAENFLAGAKDAAKFGTLLGSVAGTYSAVVPKIKNGRIAGWTREKFSGRAPADTNESAARALGLTDKQIRKMKKQNPSEYRNLAKHVTEDLGITMKDSTKSLFMKNEKIIKDASRDLDALYPELDSLLRTGDDLGESFAGSANAEVASSLVDDLNSWVKNNITVQNPNGKTVLRPGITESELRSTVNEIENIKKIFGADAAEKTLQNFKELKSLRDSSLAKKQFELSTLKQNLKKSEQFKAVPELKSKRTSLQTSKKDVRTNSFQKVLKVDRDILTNKKLIIKAKTLEEKARLRTSNVKLQNTKQEIKLKLKEDLSTINNEIAQLNSSIAKSPKIKDPAHFKASIKKTQSSIDQINKDFKSKTAPLKREIVDFNTSALKSVDASKIRELRNNWSAKADWSKPWADLSNKARMARRGYELLNDKISDLASLVEASNPTIANNIRLANLKTSTGLKLSNSLEALSDKKLGLQEGAMKFLFGSLAKSTGLGGPIPFIIQSRATYDILKGLGESNLVHRMHLLSSVEKANKVVERKVTKSIGKFFKDKIKPTASKLTLNSLMKSDLSKEINEDSGSERKPKTRQEAFKNISTNLTNLVTNPEDLIDKATSIHSELSEAAPETKNMIAQNLIQSVQYLQEKLPKSANMGTNELMKREWAPGTIELAKFERILEAVENPLSILEDLKNGTITREAAEAIKVLKPQLYRQIQEAVMEHIQSSKDTIPYEKRLNLGILLDIESDPALNPFNIAGLQDLHNEAQISQTGGASSFTATKASKLDLAESEQTPVEKAERR